MVPSLLITVPSRSVATSFGRFTVIYTLLQATCCRGRLLRPRALFPRASSGLAATPFITVSDPDSAREASRSLAPEEGIYRMLPLVA